jgi:hypothetical protein
MQVEVPICLYTYLLAISANNCSRAPHVFGPDASATHARCPSSGCYDIFGNSLDEGPKYFVNKDRMFDPDDNPRYANDLRLPSLLVKYHPILKTNQLHVGLEYGGEHVHDGFNCGERDTIVMSVGGREMNGRTCGSR